MLNSQALAICIPQPQPERPDQLCPAKLSIALLGCKWIRDKFKKSRNLRFQPSSISSVKLATNEHSNPTYLLLNGKLQHGKYKNSHLFPLLTSVIRHCVVMQWKFIASTLFNVRVMLIIPNSREKYLLKSLRKFHAETPAYNFVLQQPHS